MIFPSVVVAGGAPKVTFLDLRHNSANAFVYTYSGVSFGTPGATRRIVVGALVGTSDALSVRIGGVAATKLSRSFWIANVPTGTSGDIVVDGSYVATAWGNSTLAVWSIERLRSSTAHDFKRWPNDAFPVSINALSKGVVLGFSLGVVSSTSNTWTGLNEHSEIPTENSRASCASVQVDTEQALTVNHTTLSGGTSYLGSPFLVSLR